MPVISPAVTRIIKNIIKREGFYSNDPDDHGNETKFGITLYTARRNGYMGKMIDLPEDLAINIYATEYVLNVNFDKILALSEKVGEEVIDTGVNMSCPYAAKFLQRSLNMFGDIPVAVDGLIGPSTIYALQMLLKKGESREAALTKALNTLQGARYFDLVEADAKQKKFAVGWFNNRVSMS